MASVRLFEGDLQVLLVICLCSECQVGARLLRRGRIMGNMSNAVKNRLKIPSMAYLSLLVKQ